MKLTTTALGAAMVLAVKPAWAGHEAAHSRLEGNERAVAIAGRIGRLNPLQARRQLEFSRRGLFGRRQISALHAAARTMKGRRVAVRFVERGNGIRWRDAAAGSVTLRRLADWNQHWNQFAEHLELNDAQRDVDRRFRGSSGAQSGEASPASRTELLRKWNRLRVKLRWTPELDSIRTAGAVVTGGVLGGTVLGTVSALVAAKLAPGSDWASLVGTLGGTVGGFAAGAWPMTTLADRRAANTRAIDAVEKQLLR